MDDPTLHPDLPPPDPARGAARAGAGRPFEDGASIEEHLERLAAGGEVPADIRERIERDPELAARVESIRADNDLLGEFAAVAARTSTPTGPAPHEPVPGYLVVDELGRGGQGVVYRAEQKATRRPVALKLLARGVFAGDRERRRLAREIEVLASLRHPAVVTVHDGGVTDDGRPWLAMELVEGRRFDEAAAALRASTSGRPRERDRVVARLVRDVAAGIEAAHARGVMHRDLKPGNVLVDAAGAPHVLDFGLAREAGDGETSISEGGGFMGTLRYAAPEQIAGDPAAIDVRADVFALGMLLHEALAGRRPWPDPSNLEEAVARVRRTPEPLRRAARGAAPDLETIALRCLAGQPDRRYPSAGHVREELDRFLDRRPITARRDSTTYRLRMLVRRRPVEAAATMTIAVLLIAFAVTAGWQAARLADRSARYREAASTIVAAIAEVKRDEETGLPDLADLLEQIAGVIETRLPDDPAVGIRARRELGAALLLERRLDTAERLLRDAVTIDDGHPGAVDARERSEVLHALGQVLYAQGRFEDATAIYTEALAWRRRTGTDAEDTVATARTMAHLAACHRVQRHWPEAGRLYREALALTESVRPADDLDVLKRRNSYAVFLTDRGRFGPAVEQLRTLEASFRRTDRVRTTGGGTCLVNLARGLVALGDFEAAAAAAAEAHAIRLEIDPADDRRVGQSLALLGRIDLERGLPAEAITRLDAAIMRLEAAGGPATPMRATALTDRAIAGLALGDDGRVEAAVTDASAAMRIRGLEPQADPGAARIGAADAALAARPASVARTMLAMTVADAAIGEHERAAARLAFVVDAFEDLTAGHEPATVSAAVAIAERLGETAQSERLAGAADAVDAYANEASTD